MKKGVKLRVSLFDLTSSVLVFIFVVLYLFIVFGIYDKQGNMSVLMQIQFAIIGGVSFFSIIKDKQPYSLNKMHWWFMFIFMFLAPIIHLCTNYWPWQYKLSIDNMEFSNWLILLWSFVFYCSYNCNKFFVVKLKQNTLIDSVSFSRKEYSLLALLTVISVCALVHLVGVEELFERGKAMSFNGAFEFVLRYFFRAVPVISSAILLYRYNKEKSFFLGVICLLSVFIVNYPVALSRYWTAVVYLGLLICIIPDKFWGNKNFDLLIFIGLVVIFPFLRFFKYVTLGEITNIDIDFGIERVFYSSDFDAYSMLCRIVEYVEQYGFTYGEQIKSVLLFFIPRTIWNVKGTATGEMVSSEQGAIFTNLSAPMMGEAYIDFGILGVVIYAIMFSRIFKYLDYTYWKKSDCFIVSYVSFIVPFFMGFVVFLMRGAFQPIIIRIMGFFLFLIIIYFLKKVEIKFHNY